MASGTGESPGPDKRPPGFIESFQHIFGAISEVALVRAELAGIESKAALSKVGRVVAYFVLATLLLGTGFIYLSLSLIYVLAEKAGWGWGLALLAAGIGLLLVTAIFVLLARRALKGNWFPVTLSELRKDAVWLKRQKITNESAN